MKIYGFSSGIDSAEGPLPLTEVSFLAEPGELREVARFLNQVAGEMENLQGFRHSHLCDIWEGWNEGDPDVIVVNPQEDVSL